MTLPPQLDADAEGLESMVVRFPRAPDVARIRRRRVFRALVVLGALLVGLPLAVAVHLGVGVVVVVVLGAIGMGLQGWVTPVPTEWTIRLSRASLEIDGTEHAWPDLAEVRWECEPPRTDLVLVRHDGSTVVYACDRRDFGDDVGVTRRQRDWLTDRARSAIEAAGTREAVPAALADLQR